MSVAPRRVRYKGLAEQDESILRLANRNVRMSHEDISELCNCTLEVVDKCLSQHRDRLVDGRRKQEFLVTPGKVMSTPDEQDKAILDLANRRFALSHSRLAELLDVSVETVDDCLTRNVEKLSPRRVKTEAKDQGRETARVGVAERYAGLPEMDERIVRIANSQHRRSHNEIADELGVSTKTVDDCLAKHVDRLAPERLTTEMLQAAKGASEMSSEAGSIIQGRRDGERVFVDSEGRRFRLRGVCGDITALRARNPCMSPSAIADACGTTERYVLTTLTKNMRDGHSGVREIVCMNEQTHCQGNSDQRTSHTEQASIASVITDVSLASRKLAASSHPNGKKYVEQRIVP